MDPEVAAELNQLSKEELKELLAISRRRKALADRYVRLVRKRKNAALRKRKKHGWFKVYEFKPTRRIEPTEDDEVKGPIQFGSGRGVGASESSLGASCYESTCSSNISDASSFISHSGRSSSGSDSFGSYDSNIDSCSEEEFSDFNEPLSERSGKSIASTISAKSKSNASKSEKEVIYKFAGISLKDK